MKVSKTLVIPLAGLLLVGAAGAALATSAAAPAVDTGSVIPAVESPSPSATTATKPPRDGALTDVLTDLVTKGTITAAQKTAILDALSAERTARQAERAADRASRQAERAADRAARQADREKVRGFLSDGVITKAELDQLPADHPLRQLTTLMDDGKITLDELKSVGRGALKDMGMGGVRGWMRGGPNAPAAPTASPTTGS
ncbi:MAG: hypothetical protein ACYC65_12655 [Candidatus Limnocylindrales bacterium]